MTGYLQNLVHRAVDDSRHLRPRLPSHFEPVVPQVAPAATDDFEDTGEARSQRGQEGDDPNPSSARKDILHVPSVPEGRRSFKQSDALQDSSLAAEETNTRRSVNQPRASLDGINNQVEAPVSFEHKVPTDRGATLSTRAEFPTRKLLTQPQDIAVLVPLSPARRTATGSSAPLANTASRSPGTEPGGSRTGPAEEENKTRLRPQTSSHRPQPEPFQTQPADRMTDDKSTQSKQRFDSVAVVHDTTTPTRSRDLKSMSERDSEIRLLMAELRNSSSERRTESAVLKSGGLQPTMPQPQPQQMRLMDNDARAPQQSINVTIGRIEIKAVAANDTPRSRRSERPAVMSLEEYLSQSAMGGSK